MFIKNDFIATFVVIHSECIIVPTPIISYKKQIFYFNWIVIENKKITILVYGIDVCISKIATSKIQKNLYVLLW